MSDNVDRLFDLLGKERDLYQEILTLSKEKKEIIVEGKTKELNEMTQKERKMIKIIIDFEKNRSSIVEAIEKDLGIGRIENITELLDFLDEPDRRTLTALKEDLKTVVKELGHQNEMNGKLIGQSLEIIDFNLNLLSSSNNQHAGYGSDADETDVNRKSNLFDARV